MYKEIKGVDSPFRLSVYKREFYVNEKKGVVTCKLTCYFKVPGICWSAWSGAGSNIVVTAKSVCAKEDEFNEKIGKEIAEARAEQKAYVKAMSEINDMRKTFRLIDDAASKFFEKACKCCEHDDEYIARIGGK